MEQQKKPIRGSKTSLKPTCYAGGIPPAPPSKAFALTDVFEKDVSSESSKRGSHQYNVTMTPSSVSQDVPKRVGEYEFESVSSWDEFENSAEEELDGEAVLELRKLKERIECVRVRNPFPTKKKKRKSERKSRKEEEPVAPSPLAEDRFRVSEGNDLSIFIATPASLVKKAEPAEDPSPLKREHIEAPPPKIPPDQLWETLRQTNTVFPPSLPPPPVSPPLQELHVNRILPTYKERLKTATPVPVRGGAQFTFKSNLFPSSLTSHFSHPSEAVSESPSRYGEYSESMTMIAMSPVSSDEEEELANPRRKLFIKGVSPNFHWRKGSEEDIF
ncbi:hypothetical protein AGDE_13623 [Angomonas deanei]|nr:hypothetical protein AGDE_13623 [Angomonas deanei]|eukprot:EPY22051.1 hypothetical protein AGDE_13623 [Angomonas deanei]